VRVRARVRVRVQVLAQEWATVRVQVAGATV